MSKCEGCMYWPKCEEYPFDESGCSDFVDLIYCEDCRYCFNLEDGDICRRPGLNGDIVEIAVAPEGFCAWGESRNGSI